MLDRMGRAGAWSLALSIAALAPRGAAAQPELLEITPDGATCAPPIACIDASIRCPAGLECAVVGREPERELCLPHNPVFCCESEADCVGLVGTGTAPDCRDVMGLGAGVCLPPERSYCGEPISMRRLVACHTSRASVSPVSYENGDCDRDGVSNGVERDAGTDPCLPERIGVWVPTDTGPRCVTGPAEALRCAEPGDACTLPDESTGVCVEGDDTGGQALCSAPPHVFCCGGMAEVECPTGDACTLPRDIDDAYGVCTPADKLCSPEPTAAELMACHSFAGTLTDYEHGDCDGDGIANAEDQQRCVPDRPDAGITPNDGGSNTADAGGEGDAGSHEFDAGIGLDAGATPIGPGFNGGGGCACRGAQGAPSAGGWWIPLVALALVIARRR